MYQQALPSSRSGARLVMRRFINTAKLMERRSSNEKHTTSIQGTDITSLVSSILTAYLGDVTSAVRRQTSQPLGLSSQIAACLEHAFQ